MSIDKRKKAVLILLLSFFILIITGIKLGAFGYIYDLVIEKYDDYQVAKYWKKRAHILPYEEDCVTIHFKRDVGTSTIKKINQQFGAEVLNVVELGGTLIEIYKPPRVVKTITAKKVIIKDNKPNQRFSPAILSIIFNTTKSGVIAKNIPII